MYPGKALPAESESSQNKPLVKGIVSKALAWTAHLCAVPGTASASKEADAVRVLICTLALISKVPAKAECQWQHFFGLNRHVFILIKSAT